VTAIDQSINQAPNQPGSGEGSVSPLTRLRGHLVEMHHLSSEEDHGNLRPRFGVDARSSGTRCLGFRGWIDISMTHRGESVAGLLPALTSHPRSLS
jgi:hypothetical protein